MFFMKQYVCNFRFVSSVDDYSLYLRNKHHEITHQHCLKTNKKRNRVTTNLKCDITKQKGLS